MPVTAVAKMMVINSDDGPIKRALLQRFSLQRCKSREDISNKACFSFGDSARKSIRCNKDGICKKYSPHARTVVTAPLAESSINDFRIDSNHTFGLDEIYPSVDINITITCRVKISYRGS